MLPLRSAPLRMCFLLFFVAKIFKIQQHRPVLGIVLNVFVVSDDSEFRPTSQISGQLNIIGKG